MFIDRKSLKRVHFGAGGLSLSAQCSFSTGAKTISNQNSSSAKSVVIIPLNDSGLTKDSVNCTASVEINCPSCRELKGPLAWPSIYCVLGATTCRF